jgi:hypothetical protein
MSNEDATPIVQNKRKPFDVVAGDYVFASRWGDCDPGDPWAVGYVEEVGTENVRLTNSPRFWPCAMKITHEQGTRICAEYPAMERLPMDYEAIARVFGVTPPGELEYASWVSAVPCGVGVGRHQVPGEEVPDGPPAP